jgi:hypothetical protein
LFILFVYRCHESLGLQRLYMSHSHRVKVKDIDIIDIG